MANLRLTDINQATAVTSDSLIHIVNTGDTTQFSGGSSYKASLSQVFDSLSAYTIPNLTVNSFSSNTISATTIDLCTSNGTLYTDSISGCSPINFLSESNFVSGLTATTVSATTYENLPVSGVTSTGTGVSLISSIVDGDVRIKSISGNTLGKISADTISETVELDVVEPNLDLWSLVVQGNRLLYGEVSYVSGLTFEITNLKYIINGDIYTSSGGTIVLPSGSTDDRIDVIYADTSSLIGSISGTPSPNPEKPVVDGASQVEVTFVNVPASASSLNFSGYVIYNENVGPPSEWTFGSGGSQPTRIIGNNTTIAYTGTTSIRVSAVTSLSYTTYFRLTGSTAFDTNDYAVLQFAIRNLVSNSTSNRIQLRFLTTGGTQNGSSVFMNALGSVGYVQYSSTNTSSWQLISIPLWRFYLTNTNVQVLEVSFWPIGGIAQSNYYFDYFEFRKGSSSSPPTNSWTTIRGDLATPSITATNPNSTLIISGGTNIGSTVTSPNRVNINLDNYITLSGVTATTDSSFNGVRIGKGGSSLLTNTSIGNNSLLSNTFGTNNTSIGYASLSGNTFGNDNTSIGYNSMLNGSFGNNNVSIGSESLYSSSNANNNVSIGQQSQYFNTGGAGNVSVGTLSLRSLTTGGGNIAIGSGTLYSNTTSSFNTSVGNQSLRNNNASFNVAIGHQSLYYNTTGFSNTSVGANSSFNNTIGSKNTDLGFETLYNNVSGSSNTAIGYNSMYNTTGSFNTSLGSNTLTANTVGSTNVSIGESSLLSYKGNGTTSIGYQSGSGLTVGDNNTFLGKNTSVSIDGISGSTAIGYGTSLKSSNTIILGSGEYVGIGNSTPTANLHISGLTGYNQLRLETSHTPTGTTDSTGNIGDISWDSTYFYWKTSGGWLRVSGATWP